MISRRTAPWTSWAISRTLWTDGGCFAAFIMGVFLLCKGCLVATLQGYTPFEFQQRTIRDRKTPSNDMAAFYIGPSKEESVMAIHALGNEVVLEMSA